MTALEIILATCAVEWFALDWYVLSHRWDDSTFYDVDGTFWRKLAPARIPLNGWPRLRRWLTDGPLPEIRRINIERRPGCGGDCDGCYVDTCPTFWCRGVWLDEKNHKSSSQV